MLLPAALQKWLPDDHLAYFISDVVDQLDLSDITGRYEGERRGGPPYHPRMMVKVLLYGYCVGVSSSRRIAQRLHEDIAFRVLAANNTPDFRTIRDFRKDNLDALSGLFLQVLALCQQAGLVKLGHVCPASTIFAGWRQSVLPVHLLGLDALLGSVGPVAGDVKLQDDGVVHDPVNRRGGGHGVGKDALPLREDQV